MSTDHTVIAALRQFLPAYLEAGLPISIQQKRAIWAISHCRTPTMGGHRYACENCNQYHYQYHSCNHRSCPQCGRLDTAKWVNKQMQKRVGTTYYMVTFTLPSELRSLFFSRFAKTVFDLFFQASSAALKEKLAEPKYLGAVNSGFIGVLHTWNQQLHFHPHIHYIVPATGINAKDKVITVKGDKYLVNIERLKGAFRDQLKRRMEEHNCPVDPAIWRLNSKKWAINIKNFGNGNNAIKYLGRYVCRTAIGDSRILKFTDSHVTFQYKNRDNGKLETTTITGIEFVKRYLRHVLPRGLRSIRYAGFMHPSAKKTHHRIVRHFTLLDGESVPNRACEQLKALLKLATQKPACPDCEQEMVLVAKLSPIRSKPRPRAPPNRKPKTTAI